MEIVVHTGAHQTDEDRLLKVLLRNADDFARRGVAVPGPSRYRSILKESFLALDDAHPATDAREILLDAILDGAEASRLLLSNPHFFGSQRFAVLDGQIYPLGGHRMAQFASLFPGDRFEMFMAIRNPASFLPAVLRRATPEKMTEILAGRAPTELRWSDTILRIRDATPDVSVTVWCNEDSPLIWAQIVREMAGLEHGRKITGGFDLLANIMSREGMKRFRAYLHENPNMPELQKRRVIEAFLGKYAIDEAVEEELDLPGWTDLLVDQMTRAYDEDVERIARIPGVTLIAP